MQDIPKNVAVCLCCLFGCLTIAFIGHEAQLTLRFVAWKIFEPTRRVEVFNADAPAPPLPPGTPCPYDDDPTGTIEVRPGEDVHIEIGPDLRPRVIPVPKKKPQTPEEFFFHWKDLYGPKA